MEINDLQSFTCILTHIFCRSRMNKFEVDGGFFISYFTQPELFIKNVDTYYN
jgi:hypothetical protein